MMIIFAALTNFPFGLWIDRRQFSTRIPRADIADRPVCVLRAHNIVRLKCFPSCRICCSVSSCHVVKEEDGSETGLAELPRCHGKYSFDSGRLITSQDRSQYFCPPAVCQIKYERRIPFD